MQSKAATVAAYLAELPADRVEDLRRLRALVRSVAPDAREGMRYGMPSYELGSLLCSFAAQKQHTSLYVMDTKVVERFRAQLGKLDAGKGCIRFRRLEDAPIDVLRAILTEAVARRRAGETVAPCDGR